jgi:hypothetical protein
MKRLLALTFCLSLLAPGVFAQAKVPTLDENDVLVIQVVQQSVLRANDACSGLEAVKNAQAFSQQANERFAKKYPDYTVDLAKGVLVLKAKPADKK